jgi:hypothetical protein
MNDLIDGLEKKTSSDVVDLFQQLPLYFRWCTNSHAKVKLIFKRCCLNRSWIKCHGDVMKCGLVGNRELYKHNEVNTNFILDGAWQRRHY